MAQIYLVFIYGVPATLGGVLQEALLVSEPVLPAALTKTHASEDYINSCLKQYNKYLSLMMIPFPKPNLQNRSKHVHDPEYRIWLSI